MPRFFFHIIEGDTHITDEEGLELPDLASAHQEALLGLRSILAAEVERGCLNLGRKIVITDGSRELHSVSGRDAVQLTGL